MAIYYEEKKQFSMIYGDTLTFQKAESNKFSSINFQNLKQLLKVY